jgi:two-component system sensor histidine kinase AlgZ
VNPPLPRPQRDSKWAYWACQLTGWGLYGGTTLLAAALISHVPWTAAALEAAALCGIGLGLTHLLRLFMAANGWRRLSLKMRITRVIAASVLLSVPATILMRIMNLDTWQAGDVPIATSDLRWLFVSGVQMINWTALLAFWCTLYFAVLAVRDRKSAELRESELIRALQLSELRVLKSQLNPHYLFNALNTVRALIADDPARAQTAVTQLARTLRYTLSSGQEELVSLEQELAIVDDYLELQALRLGERLHIERDISPASCQVRIPVMLLQTLVENAIKHGIAELPEGGVLRIAARMEQGALTLEVENPCPSQPQHASQEGIGLRNAGERLRLLFGPGATLNLDLTRPARAAARAYIPPSA